MFPSFWPPNQQPSPSIHLSAKEIPISLLILFSVVTLVLADCMPWLFKFQTSNNHCWAELNSDCGFGLRTLHLHLLLEEAEVPVLLPRLLQALLLFLFLYLFLHGHGPSLPFHVLCLMAAQHLSWPYRRWASSGCCGSCRVHTRSGPHLEPPSTATGRVEQVSG